MSAGRGALQKHGLNMKHLIFRKIDKPLQKRLKSRDRSVRYAAIYELTELEMEEAVSALKVIAKGKKRAWLSWYDFDDQKCALNALLKIGTEETKDFLLNFFKEEVKEHSSSWEYPGGDRVWRYRLHQFPNAGGALGRRLKYTETICEGQVVGHHHNPGGGSGWSGYKIIPYDAEAHNIRKYIHASLKFRVVSTYRKV